MNRTETSQTLSEYQMKYSSGSGRANDCNGCKNFNDRFFEHDLQSRQGPKSGPF